MPHVEQDIWNRILQVDDDEREYIEFIAEKLDELMGVIGDSDEWQYGPDDADIVPYHVLDELDELASMLEDAIGDAVEIQNMLTDWLQVVKHGAAG